MKVKDYFISIVAVLEDNDNIIDSFIWHATQILKKNYENYELVLIDNNSSDDTEKIVSKILKKEQCIRYVRLNAKCDYEVALSAGLESAIGDVIITIDPQLDPSKLIPNFVKKTIETQGVVYGIRKNYDNIMPLYYRVGKSMYHLFCKVFFKFSPPKNAGFYMGFSRNALNAITSIKGKSKFLRVYGRQIDYKTANLEYKIAPMSKRITIKSFTQSLNYALATLFVNSNRPLRVISAIGMLAASINLIYVVTLLIHAVTRNQEITPFIASSLQNSTAYFFLFLIITLFIEYVIRNMENSKEGPSYQVAYEKNSNVMIIDKEERKNVV